MITCPLCGSSRSRLLYPASGRRLTGKGLFYCTSPSYGVHGPIYSCQDCGLTYINDRTSVGEIAKHYRDVVDPLYVAEEPARIKTFRRHLVNLVNLGGRRLLDVGAYTGLFVHLARQAGWQAEGVEPSAWLVEQGRRRYQVRLRQGMLRHSYFPAHAFDVVTLWDVVEHFPGPKKQLQVCYDYLRPGGWLALSTIDIGSFVARILGSRWPWLMQMHRVYFTKATLHRVLAEVGFGRIYFRPHIRYVSLGYLWNRFLPWKLPKRLGKIIIPFYLGDLFDVYARKPR